MKDWLNFIDCCNKKFDWTLFFWIIFSFVFAETGFGWLNCLKMPAVEPKPKPQTDDIGINAILLGPPGT